MGEWFNPTVLKTVEPKGSVSSNLTLSAKVYSLIAQLVEQTTVNRPVAGSSPAQGAILSLMSP